MTRHWAGVIALLLMSVGPCRASAQDASQALTTALQTAFHRQVSVSKKNGGRILLITIDTAASPEGALRIAQFARAHDDSISALDAIEVHFVQVSQIGYLRKTTMVRAGSFLPALLPIDTTPGWVQAMLAPTPLTLAAGRLGPGVDTVGINGSTSLIESLRDTTVGGRALWRITFGSGTDSVLVDRATLLPVDERHTDLAGTVITVLYDGPHLTMTAYGPSGPGRALARDTVFAATPYSAAELDVLLKTMPLAPGYTAHFPVYHSSSVASGLDWITILVTGIDTARNAWIVDATGSGTIAFSRRWISRR